MSEKQDALAVVATQLPIKSEQANKLTRLAVFTPTNITEAMGLAKLLASSDFVPKDFKGKPGNCFLAMQMGAELGVPPLQALQNIAIINGRPSIWGDLALAVVQANPDYEDHREFFTGTPFDDNYTAVFQIKRKGQAWHETKFSVTDAKTAKLWQKRGYNGQDTPWITNPKRMLQMRSRGFGLRDKFADALKGMKLAEEIMDIPPDNRQETGTLDVKNEMATLTASSEPNRGHGNEGMVQAPALAQAPGMDQTEKKQDATICGDCQMMNGNHKPDCLYSTTVDAKGKCGECHAQGGHLPKCSLRSKATTAASPVAQDKQPESTQAQTTPNAFLKLPVRIEGLTKRATKPLRTLSVVSNDRTKVVSVWHESLIPILDKYEVDFPCLALLEVSKKEKDGKIYVNLEHILEIGAVKFVNDEAAVTGEMSGDQVGFSE
jgi:hypothetical protein